MGVVGDPLYDFYFAIFSDIDIEYKRSMMVVQFYIRLCRTYKYAREDYPIYIEYFEIIKNILNTK